VNARTFAAALVALAAAVYYLGGAPARTRLESVTAEHARVRAQKAETQQRLQALDRRAGVIARVRIVEASGQGGRAEAVQTVRSMVIQALQQSRVERVRLEVKPEKEPVLAGVSLTAQGSFPNLVHLTVLLTRPGAGLILQRVSLSISRPLSLSIEASALARSS
jgi:hypothetical protein